MTKDEYVHYSDCRQASFIWRKGTSRIFPHSCRKKEKGVPR